MRCLLFLLLFCALSNRTIAQSVDTTGRSVPVIAIHISSPLGLASKIGVKGEYRIAPHHSALLQYNLYWGYFPGWQGVAQYRYYFRPSRYKAELFVYGQGGYGQAQFNGVMADVLRQEGSSSVGVPLLTREYGLLGAGAGVHWNLGAFFMEMIWGGKKVIMNSVPDDQAYGSSIFFITGPGAYADLHFAWGFQF